ncbi:MAG: hypothetical protein BJ554DRAFT_2879, partial [Olpidium bornovanus]
PTNALTNDHLVPLGKLPAHFGNWRALLGKPPARLSNFPPSPLGGIGFLLPQRSTRTGLPPRLRHILPFEAALGRHKLLDDNADLGRVLKSRLRHR